MNIKELPDILVGGMGFNITDWSFTNLLARLGILPTLSGVGAHTLVTRILQEGDIGGHIRRASKYFPFQKNNNAERVINKYFVEGGIPKGKKYKVIPNIPLEPNEDLIDLMIFSNFALVWLAKEGHSNPISVNYLEKIQRLHIYSLIGSILAGADIITMGAGITFQIPGLLEDIIKGEEVTYRVDGDGLNGTKEIHTMSFNPAKHFGKPLPSYIKKPAFFPIVSSDSLASIFQMKFPGKVQALCVELDKAGGHNAKPRGAQLFNAKGEPIYGERDKVNFDKLRKLGIPFWVGGSYASPEMLKLALSVGAQGIQVGSIFALCNESNMAEPVKAELRRLGYRGELEIFTDPKSSPTGYPFKVAKVKGTLSEDEIFINRKRICDQGFLTTPYRKEDGSVGYRCAAENIESYVRKGGLREDSVNAKCLCNGLLANTKNGNGNEPMIITLGDDYSFLSHLMNYENDSYSAEQALNYLLTK